MEKVISVEERIRRAEERYNRKNGSRNFYNNRSISENIKNENKRYSKRKLIFQIFICLIIYICFYGIKNWDYVFSDNFKNDINSFFTEDTKIYEIYSDIKSYFENDLFKKDSSENENKQNNEIPENAENAESTESTNENQKPNQEQDQNTSEENVGGANEILNEESHDEVASVEETQMEKDAREIKSKLSFINPIEGRISSTFGWRNPTISTVPKYHTGLDIAAVTGTVIKSATDGTVTLVSSKGDYGKHYYITYDNITIVYAHCSKLYLKEGDKVTKGQEIAEVGSTGNSTGPHLHIGIKLDDRWVDPQLILDI